MSDNDVAMFFIVMCISKNYKGLSIENVEKMTNLVNFLLKYYESTD